MIYRLFHEKNFFEILSITSFLRKYRSGSYFFLNSCVIWRLTYFEIFCQKYTQQCLERKDYLFFPHFFSFFSLLNLIVYRCIISLNVYLYLIAFSVSQIRLPLLQIGTVTHLEFALPIVLQNMYKCTGIFTYPVNCVTN